jgi:hypothetical protein
VTTLATSAVLVVIAYRLVQGFVAAVRGQGRVLAVAIIRSLRPRHFWPVPIVFAAVIAVAVAAMTVPPLRWGWWSALGGVGNPILGSTTATAGSWLDWAIPATFMALLAPALPLFAHREEQIFRQGVEHQGWPTRVRRAVTFGLVHALIGIPIGVALALTVGGLYFTIVYLRTFTRTGSQREAVLESTRAHTAYNASIVALVIVVVITAQ